MYERAFIHEHSCESSPHIHASQTCFTNIWKHVRHYHYPFYSGLLVAHAQGTAYLEDNFGLGREDTEAGEEVYERAFMHNIPVSQAHTSTPPKRVSQTLRGHDLRRVQQFRRPMPAGAFLDEFIPCPPSPRPQCDFLFAKKTGSHYESESVSPTFPSSMYTLLTLFQIEAIHSLDYVPTYDL